jgi:hypothetical protein
MVLAILESLNWEILIMDELFCKLKLSEIEHKLKARLRILAHPPWPFSQDIFLLQPTLHMICLIYPLWYLF